MRTTHILAQRSAAFNPDWAISVLLNCGILHRVLSCNILSCQQAEYRGYINKLDTALICIGQWGCLCPWHGKSCTLFGRLPVTVFSFHYSPTKPSYETMNGLGQRCVGQAVSAVLAMPNSLPHVAGKGEHPMKRSQSKTTQPRTYKKGTIQPGPASLPTALLLDNQHFTKVIHRDISPAIPLPAAPHVNISTILPTVENHQLVSECIDTFLYIIDLFPQDYFSLKANLDGAYGYLNGNFRALADQLGVAVLDKTERECLKPTHTIHNPLIASIRRTDPHFASKTIKWVEEEATDNNDSKHYFYSWKIPVFTVKEKGPLLAIFTRTLAFSPSKVIPFKKWPT